MGVWCTKLIFAICKHLKLILKSDVEICTKCYQLNMQAKVEAKTLLIYNLPSQSISAIIPFDYMLF